MKNEARAFTVRAILAIASRSSPIGSLNPASAALGLGDERPCHVCEFKEQDFFSGGIVSIDEFDSILGRASLRLGTNITQGIYTWQPFVSASVIHEFAGEVKSKVTLLQGENGVPFPDSVADPSPNGLKFNTSTERFGTYGQFGLGSAIVVGNTGWLGYGRADVKVGENIQGMGFNVGLRYQW